MAEGRKARETRARILDAALECFTTRGYHRSRTVDLADLAGVSEGTIYKYYPSKQALFEALCEAKIAEYAERLNEILATTPAGFPSLVAFLRLELSFCESDPRRAELFHRVVRDVSREAHKAVDLFGEHIESFKFHLGHAYGLAEGEPVSDDVLNAYMGFVDMVIVRWSVWDRSPGLADRAEAMARFLWKLRPGENEEVVTP